MDDQQQSRWRPTRRQLVWAGGIAALVFLIVMVCGYLLGWKWTGLPKRTLWDWLDLLIIPLVLALGGYLFTRSENQATRVAAEQRGQDEAMQAYLDQIGQLLLDKNLRGSEEGSEVSSLARARTLTLLPRLDGGRKDRVVQFLYESGLIDKDRLILGLEGADLRGAKLYGADLRGASLERAALQGADLRWAKLQGADLRGADLRGAKLSVARLGEADLSGAFLSGADLGWADLSGADLWGTRLGGADLLVLGADLGGVNLRRANLRGASGINNEELEQQATSLEGATMPNGQKYEDWIKDEGGHGEDLENSDHS